MFYFIPGTYQPNTAATNRCLAYLRFFSENKISTRAVFFTTNRDKAKMPVMPGIDCDNEWEKCLFKNGPLKYISLLFRLMLFRWRLKKGDVVYCYENVNYWKLFLKKEVSVYAEYTENPDIIGFGGQFLRTSKKSFINVCHRLSGLFVISTSLKEYFVDMGIGPDKIHIINMIVDEKRFAGIDKDETVPPYIAYCGTVSNNKDGVDELIRSFALFSNKHPEVKLYIIGSVPSNTEESEIIRLISQLGINEKVVLTGVISSSEMPKLLKNACILALDRPRNIQAEYGFPTKLGEYLMSANPVVITKVGDIPNFLTDGESAYLAEPNNIKSFVDKLIEAYENPEKAKIVGIMGKKVADEHFSYEIESEKLAMIMGVL